jgi:hypothetical protein
MTQQALKQVPLWVRHFLIHVIKRCCGIVVKWIDDVEEANR